jgi:hypothetical protein
MKELIPGTILRNKLDRSPIRPGHVCPEGLIIAVDTLKACLLVDDELLLISKDTLSTPTGSESKYILDGEIVTYNRLGFAQTGYKLGYKMDCVLIYDQNTGKEHYVGKDQVCLPS